MSRFLVITLLILSACAQTDAPEGKVQPLAVKERADGNLQYETGVDFARAREDCARRGGSFNKCGSACGPDAEFCVQVCVPICEFGEASAIHDVKIEDGQFTPKLLEVQAGDLVSWTNLDGKHTVTQDDGAFDSGALGEGQSFSHTFEDPGRYTYHSTYADASGAVLVR